MASFGQTFDASSVAPSSNYDVLPPGKYLGQIVASEMRPTKDGTGQYLYLEVDILEGQYAGRKLFDRLNLVNANPDTVEIAKRTLSSICRAVGKMQVSNSEQLHLIPITLDVRVTSVLPAPCTSSFHRWYRASRSTQARTGSSTSSPVGIAGATPV